MPLVIVCSIRAPTRAERRTSRNSKKRSSDFGDSFALLDKLETSKKILKSPERGSIWLGLQWVFNSDSLDRHVNIVYLWLITTRKWARPIDMQHLVGSLKKKKNIQQAQPISPVGLVKHLRAQPSVSSERKAKLVSRVAWVKSALDSLADVFCLLDFLEYLRNPKQIRPAVWWMLCPSQVSCFSLSWFLRQHGAFGGVPRSKPCWRAYLLW